MTMTLGDIWDMRAKSLASAEDFGLWDPKVNALSPRMMEGLDAVLGLVPCSMVANLVQSQCPPLPLWPHLG
jgi:hypothetical protein